MSQDRRLQRIRRWPHWAIIPIGLGLAGLAVVVGLLLEPAAIALTSVQEEPTPTLPAIAYSQGLSDACHDCHFSLSALQASAADPDMAKAYLIEPESVVTPHGRLGCLACHGGDGEPEGQDSAAKEAAHQGLVSDMTAQDPEKCLICHQDLPSEIPGDRLRAPHGTIKDHVEQGSPCGVYCSDCHGGVGHGFDPVSGEKFCSMTVCVDCHQQRALDFQITDCDACHLGPHEAIGALTCSDCHASTTIWSQVELDTHPMPLLGKHAEPACFQCHQYPDFDGLSAVCSACHQSGHADWAGDDCAQCHESGGTWDLAGDAWDGHVEHWDQYKGEHLKVACAGCHFEGYAGIDSNCDACHRVPDSHSDGRNEIGCVGCHQAEQPWTEFLP